MQVPAKAGVIGQPMTHLPAELPGDCSEHVLAFVKFNFDNTMNAAARRPFGFNLHPQRTAAFNQVVEDLIGYCLVKNSAISEIKEIILERF